MTEPIGIPDKLPVTSADVVQRAHAALDGDLIGCIECFVTADCEDVKQLVRGLLAEVEKLRGDFADEPYLTDRLRDARRERDEAQTWAAWFAAERDEARTERGNALGALIVAESKVDELRAEVDRLRPLVADCYDGHRDVHVNRDTASRAEAAVERVRKLADTWDTLGTYDLPSAPYAPGFATALRRALDGEAQ